MERETEACRGRLLAWCGEFLLESPRCRDWGDFPSWFQVRILSDDHKTTGNSNQLLPAIYWWLQPLSGPRWAARHWLTWEDWRWRATVSCSLQLQQLEWSSREAELSKAVGCLASLNPMKSIRKWRDSWAHRECFALKVIACRFGNLLNTDNPLKKVSKSQVSDE